MLKVVHSIVFVHGLRGDAFTTWTKDQICWPRDLLRHDIPHARIMSVSMSQAFYKFDADVDAVGIRHYGDSHHRLCE